MSFAYKTALNNYLNTNINHPDYYNYNDESKNTIIGSIGLLTDEHFELLKNNNDVYENALNKVTGLMEQSFNGHSGFSMSWTVKNINTIINSELFKSYMNNEHIGKKVTI